MNYILDRAKEPSTWRGLALMLAAFGVSVNPEGIMQIGTAAGAVIAAIEIFRKG